MPVKAMIIDLDHGAVVPVQYNPQEYTYGLENDGDFEIEKIVFRKTKKSQFVANLFFDASRDNLDVRILVKAVEALMHATVDGKDRKRPPICQFVWGDFLFRGIIKKMDQKFTMFSSLGFPLRADVAVTFTEMASPNDYAEKAGLNACRKLWMVKTGDRLDIIAYATLRDPSQWRAIAEENDIEDPLAFPQAEDVGRRLAIPDIYAN